MDSSREIVRKLRENRLLNEQDEYDSMDHKDLVKLAQGGDQFALETLMKAYDSAISKAASKFIFDSGDRDDAKQIASIGFWEAVQNWEGKGSFGAYANMVMNRKLTDQLRKDSAGKELIHSQAASMDAPVASDDEGGEMTLGASLPSNGLSPEEEYLGRDGARKITEFMKNNLSDTERQVILKYIEGYKVSEISEETGMKYKSVENAIKRVKDKLAEFMRHVNESRKMRMNESIFSDKEKEILVSVINKIDNKPIQESSIEYDMDYEDQLNQIESDLEDAIGTIKHTRSESAYQEAMDKLEELEDQIWDILEIEDHDIVQDAKRLQKEVWKAQEMYPENIKKSDPYEDVGMSRSDFF